MKQSIIRFLLLALLLTGKTYMHAIEFEVNGIKYETTSSSTIKVAHKNDYSGDIVIPESVDYKGTTYSVTSIDNEAFRKCSSLTSVSIPNSVTSIGKLAFAVCSGLTSVSIGNSVKSIGDYAFQACAGLTSVSIPNSVTSIGNWAFGGCRGLISVTIGNDISSESDCARIGYEAFYYCESLKSLSIGIDVVIGDTSFEGCNNISTLTFNCPKIENWFSGMESIEKVIIGNKVNTIGYRAFYNCRNLTTAIIEDGVEAIDEEAFYSCKKLSPVIFPNSLTFIGNKAFFGCSSITSITIPDSVTGLGDFTFAACGGLNYVSIGTGLDVVPMWTFQLSNNLISLYVNSKRIRGSFHDTSFKEVIIGDNVEEIFSSAFTACSQLKTLTLGKNVKSIGRDGFTECKFSSITIKSSPITLHKAAFWRCSVKTIIYQCKEVYSSINSTVPPSEIVFSDSVASIHDNAFISYNMLTSVTSESMTPPDLEENAFNNETYENATLNVPIGSATLYSQHQYWKKFKKIVEKDASSINTISNNTDEAERIYNLSGKVLDADNTDNLPKGIYIINGQKVVIK